MSKGSPHPSIHIVGPTPTSSSTRGGDQHQYQHQTSGTGNFDSFLGPSTLPLLAAHTKGKTKDLPFFNATVLELVKLVQVGLALFGMYDVKDGLSCTGGVLIDGLLCDVTVRGIERWIAEIGEPRVGLEVSPFFIFIFYMALRIFVARSLACRANSRSYLCIGPFESHTVHS